jgi:hypothetical protein
MGTAASYVRRLPERRKPLQRFKERVCQGNRKISSRAQSFAFKTDIRSPAAVHFPCSSRRLEVWSWSFPCEPVAFHWRHPIGERIHFALVIEFVSVR